jgi:hypothetical protein
MPLILDGTNGETFPTWTTATRPASPNTNQLGYNSTYGGYELWNGSAWSTISGGPTFSAYQSVAQSPGGATNTKIQFQTEDWDTANCFDSTTNYRFTPTVAGYYQINAGVAWSTNNYLTVAYIYKNGATHKTGVQGVNGICTVNSLVYFNGSTDYIEIYAYTATSQPTVIATYNTYFNGSFVRGV